MSNKDHTSYMRRQTARIKKLLKQVKILENDLEAAEQQIQAEHNKNSALLLQLSKYSKDLR